MRHIQLIVASLIFVLMISIGYVEATRGGGGGRGGGGAGGAHFSASRTPSMGAGQFSAHGASQFRNPTFNSTQARSQVQQHLQQSNQGINPQNLNQRQSFQNLQSRNQNNALTAQRMQQRINNNHPGYNNWFNDQFNQRHNYNPNYYGNANWWQGANWYGMNDWVAGDWTTPVYYDYQENAAPAPVVVENYPVQQPIYSQGEPVTGQPKGDWIPIGVFAAAQDVAQAPYSNMFVQLAMNKKGEIAGSYYNSATDEVHPLDGTIAKSSQVVAWNVSDNPSSPLMQTGLYNLTQDVTPVQVSFPDDTTQTWYLVKMQPPQQQK